MQNQFLFFTTLIGNEDLLKKEIELHYPSLHLSYSRKGFLTFKNTGDFLSLEKISKMEICFSLRWGNSLSMSKREDLEQKLSELKYKKIHFYSPTALSAPLKDFNENANLGEKVLTIVMLSEKEFWLGEFLCIKAFQKFPFNDPQNELPKIAPSRAYLKIAQAFSLFMLKVNSGDIFLELGSAPGGASFFLLQKGCIVYGNDPAEMSEICLKDKNFFHLKKPVQNLKENDLPLKDIKWIAVDLNLNPSQVVTETIRIASFYKNSIEGILLTLKMINLDQVRRLNFFKREFEKKGFEKIEVLQLPSHKKEFLMLLQK